MAVVTREAEKDSFWVPLVAPTSLGLALCHSLPAWWSFVFVHHGFTEDLVTLAEEDASAEDLLLHLLSVPLLALALFTSLAILLVAMPPEAKTFDHGQPEAPVALAPARKAKPSPPPPKSPCVKGMAFDDLFRAGTLAEEELRVREALAFYASALAMDPAHLPTKLQLCKTKCDLGFLIFDVLNDGPMKQFFTCASGDTAQQATALVSEALEDCKRITRDHPDDNTAFTLLALCIGRTILVETNNKKKVRLAGEMHAAALKAIELNPRDDQAHFMLARW